jgi:hypothetical protein
MRDHARCERTAPRQFVLATATRQAVQSAVDHRSDLHMVGAVVASALALNLRLLLNPSARALLSSLQSGPYFGLRYGLVPSIRGSAVLVWPLHRAGGFFTKWPPIR